MLLYCTLYQVLCSFDIDPHIVDADFIADDKCSYNIIGKTHVKQCNNLTV